MAKKRRGAIPYSSPRADGGFRLQILDPATGKRVKPRDILATEPPFYADEDELREAYVRLTAAVKLKAERSMTVEGFWEDWTDPDHWWWGCEKTGRKPQSLRTHRSHTRAFVLLYGDKRIDLVTVDDVEEYLKTSPPNSSVLTLDLMFRDAIERNLRFDNPFEQAAKRARKATGKRRRAIEQMGDTRAPEPEQVDAMLHVALTDERYPYSLYAWLLTGSEVGCRCGELDAWRWTRLLFSDPDEGGAPTYDIVEQFHNDERLGFCPPKYDSYRKILLPELLLPVLHRLKVESDGSPFVFTNTMGNHWRSTSRQRYWDDRGKRPGLRHLVGGVDMKTATRVYFATQAVLARPDRIPHLAKHYGHKDNGKTLLDFYTRLTDKHGRDGMADVYATRGRTDLREAA